VKYDQVVYKATDYACSTYHLDYDTKVEHYDDLLAEANLAFLADPTFASAKRGTCRFIYKQVLGKGFSGQGNKIRNLRSVDIKRATTTFTSHNLRINESKIPCIMLARILYKSIKKKGKRGRHSAAIKSLILISRADGDDFPTIASRFNISVHNAMRHYQTAWKLLKTSKEIKK
jgi:hypothetical protein